MSFRLHFQDLSGNSLLTHEFSEGEVTIGRSNECSIALNSNSVSRRHARFFVHLGRPYVEDLRSANGVVVNGARINGVHALVGPTVVVIGEHVVRFEPVATAPPAPEPVAEPTWRPTLVRFTGDVKEVFPLVGAKLKVGRSSRSDIQVVDASISRLHAEVRIEADSVILVDLGSANGTLWNGKQLRAPKRLSDGDVIQLGDVPLLYTEDPDNTDLATVVVPEREVHRPVDRLYFVAAGLALTVILVAAAVIWSTLSRGSGTTNAVHNARAAAASAETRGDWAGAEAAWSAALGLAPDDPEILQSLDQARRARVAQLELEACEAVLGDARDGQSGDPEAAIAAFLRAQACFESIRPESPMATQARDALARSVVPRLIELHRHLGASARSSGNLDDAIEHLRTAKRLQDARRDSGQAAHAATIDNELRNTYVHSAEAAFASEDWGRAASLYRQAAELSPLDELQAARMQEATRGTVGQR